MASSQDDMLYEHYLAFASFANVSHESAPPPPSPRQAKSRDRLQRMPRVPFIELSTDVYDELCRRRAAAEAKESRSGIVIPETLAPRDDFHPKRNQTREHLAILQQSRFRDLVLDVIYEVIRRYPSFPKAAESPPGTNGMTLQIPPQVMSNNARSPISNTLGRPLPKPLQTTTIVPAKSTMIERSDDSGEEDIALPQSIPPSLPAQSTGHNNNFTRQMSPTSVSPTSRRMNIDQKFVPLPTDARQDSPVQTSPTSDTSQRSIASRTSPSNFERQYSELLTRFTSLQERYDGLEAKMLTIERQLADSQTSVVQKDDQIKALSEQLKLASGKNEAVEEELFRTRAANKKMHAEIEVLESQFAKTRERLASKESMTVGAVDTREYENLVRMHSELRSDHDALEAKMLDQSKTTEQVRTDALHYISEIRSLAESDELTRERTERLALEVRNLQTENDALRQKIAKGPVDKMILPDRSDMKIRETPIPTNSPYVSKQGTISVASFSTFQASIDMLLSASSITNTPDAQAYFMQKVHATVDSTRNILADFDTVGVNTKKLRSRVSLASNNLVVAAKNHILSAGIFPLSVLDAAVATLVASVVDLVKVARLKTSS